MGSVEVNSVGPMAAKLETITLLRSDSQVGQAAGLSRSANDLMRSKVSRQSSQRYS
jgi:hypothetical protein